MSQVARPIVVIVDDDPDCVFLLRRLIEKISQVVVCEGGSAAIRFFADLARRVDSAPRPLACFLDVRMPACGGHEVLEAIRDDHAFDRMAVIMLSSYADPGDVAKAGQLGAQCYLVKHPSHADVTAALAGALLFAHSITDERRPASFAFPANKIAALPAPGDWAVVLTKRICEFEQAILRYDNAQSEILRQLQTAPEHIKFDDRLAENSIAIELFKRNLVVMRTELQAAEEIGIENERTAHRSTSPVSGVHAEPLAISPTPKSWF